MPPKTQEVPDIINLSTFELFHELVALDKEDITLKREESKIGRRIMAIDFRRKDIKKRQRELKKLEAKLKDFQAPKNTPKTQAVCARRGGGKR